MAGGDIRMGAFAEQPKTMYVQGLFQESLVALERLGTCRVLEDGRAFQYAENGGAGLAAGKLNQCVAPDAEFNNELVAVAAAIGDRKIQLTPGTSTAVLNLFKDGYLHINDAAGKGHMYKVKAHPAVTSATAFWITLYDAIRVALTTSSEWTLTVNQQKHLIISPTTLTGSIAGVAPIAVTADYFFWNQVRGPASVLAHDTLVIGDNVVPSMQNTPVAGAVEQSTEALSIATVVGKVIHVGASTEYALIDLCIA